jgi:hypothetical protein
MLKYDRKWIVLYKYHEIARLETKRKSYDGQYKIDVVKQ